MTAGRHGGRVPTPAGERLRAAAPVHNHWAVIHRRRILLCDADSQSVHAVRVVLHDAGFEVDVTRSAAQALDRVSVRVPAAAIIELALPDSDGVEVCRRLREWSAMPVILLSAVADEQAQLRAFEAGADDYVTKPFRPRELVGRLLAHLRRADPAGQDPCVQLDGLEIDLAARAVRRDGEMGHLTPIEFSLLGVLTQNRGRLLTHNALLSRCGARRTSTPDRRSARTSPTCVARSNQPTAHASSTPTTGSATASLTRPPKRRDADELRHTSATANSSPAAPRYPTHRRPLWPGKRAVVPWIPLTIAWHDYSASSARVAISWLVAAWAARRELCASWGSGRRGFRRSVCGRARRWP